MRDREEAEAADWANVAAETIAAERWRQECTVKKYTRRS
jgi:hypothetical protein